MKKSTMLLIVALGIGLTGCSTYIPFSYPENSLNTYNSYWDDFAGSIEEGKVYHYSNKGFSPEFQFEVLQVIDDKTILITRSGYTNVCESAVFLVISNHQYADGAKLRAGDYVANGTYTYVTKAKTQKTVYVLVEKSLYDSRNKK